MNGPVQVVLATGGTGGHIYPALALAEGLVGQGISSALLGISGGLEQQLSSEAAVPFHGVTGGKLDRSRPDPRQLFAALRGVLQARKVLRRLKPRLVIGFGGFGSLPGSAAAAFSSVPLWLNEQNSYPGLVTRLLKNRAELVIASMEAALPRLPAGRTEVIPYPVAGRVISKQEAREQLGLPRDGQLTLVMGGSQGSVALNQAVLESLRSFGEAAPATLHLTGPANLEAVLAQADGLPRHHPRGYADGALAFAAADLAITRAGIGTLSMAAFYGVPLIMVPLPSAAENHQLHNATAFADAGAGIVLPQDRLSGLREEWSELLGDHERLAQSAQNSARLSPEGALETFIERIVNRLGTEPE